MWQNSDAWHVLNPAMVELLATFTTCDTVKEWDREIQIAEPLASVLLITKLERMLNPDTTHIQGLS